MDYQRIYNEIIVKAKLENRIKLKKNHIFYVYYENHHIIPKCLGGKNEHENLVLLTAKEHYMCHKILTYIYPNNRSIACAFYRMTFDKKGHVKISARNYAYAKELYCRIPMTEETKKKIGLKSKNRTHVCSEKTKKQMRDNNLGSKNPMYGKIGWKKGLHLSENEKSHLSKLYLGKTFEEIHGFKKSEEIKKKISVKLKGKNKGKLRSKKTKEILSNTSKKYFESKENRDKTSQTTKLAMQRPEVKEKIRLAMIKRKENKLKLQMVGTQGTHNK